MRHFFSTSNERFNWFFSRKTLYIRRMKKALYTLGMTVFAISTAFTGFGQTENIQSDFLNIHVNQNTSRTELAQWQKAMSVVGIGFRYDLVNWVEGELQSIRFAIILPDGAMRRNVVENIDGETDIWIRLEGAGDERIFCAGDECND